MLLSATGRLNPSYIDHCYTAVTVFGPHNPKNGPAASGGIHAVPCMKPPYSNIGNTINMSRVFRSPYMSVMIESESRPTDQEQGFNRFAYAAMLSTWTKTSQREQKATCLNKDSKK